MRRRSEFTAHPVCWVQIRKLTLPPLHHHRLCRHNNTRVLGYQVRAASKPADARQRAQSKASAQDEARSSRAPPRSQDPAADAGSLRKKPTIGSDENLD